MCERQSNSDLHFQAKLPLLKYVTSCHRVGIPGRLGSMKVKDLRRGVLQKLSAQLVQQGPPLGICSVKTTAGPSHVQRGTLRGGMANGWQTLSVSMSV